MDSPNATAGLWASLVSGAASIFNTKLVNDGVAIDGEYKVKLAALDAQRGLTAAQYAAQLATITADRDKQLATINAKTKTQGYVVIGVVVLLVAGVIVAVVVTRPRNP